MEFSIPSSLELEHRELHTELAKAATEPGKLGEAARKVDVVLAPHFAKEEEFALPPLGLLTVLVDGKTLSEMSQVLLMTARLKDELPQMLKEHQAIVDSLAGLKDEARIARKPEYLLFAEKLILHARNEEEVLYPAVLLVGEYIKLKLAR